MSQRIGQRRRRTSQPQRQAGHLPDPGPDLAHVPLERRTYLSVASAAQYLDFPSRKAFESFLARTPRLRARAFSVGRQLRFARKDLDAFVAHGGVG